jgi:hypothetical protein
MRIPKSLSLFEVALVLVFAVVATRAIVRQQELKDGGPSLVEPPLLEMWQQRFGPDRYSMGREEWFIRDFFNDARGRTFVDVGAWEPVRGSNTYRLERDLGWSGLAIDALSELESRYAAERPRTRFFTAFITDVDHGNATLHVSRRLTEVASGSEAMVKLFDRPTEARLVPQRTLDSLLEEAAVQTFDFLNLDIEMGEPAALRSFDIDRFRPSLVCVEAHGATRQAILDYFAEHGYVLVGRYLPYDRVNLYFTPRRPRQDVD